MFHNAIQLWGVMHGQLSRCAHFLQVLIKLCAQELPSAIRVQDFDQLAVVLSRCPYFKGLVGFKGLVLGMDHVRDCVPGCIVCEGDKVSSTLVQGNGGWSPHIGMYLVSKISGRWADSDFRDGQMFCACKYAGVASCVLGIWV